MKNLAKISVIPLIFLLFALISCQQSPKTAVQLIPFPGKVPAAEPNVFSHNDQVYMSWIEKSDTLNVLKFSVLENKKWATPEIIATGTDWFVNWADFPAIFRNNNRLYAHFLEKSSPETFAYDVMLTSSSDHGESWSQPVKLHNDTVQGEHGFLSFFKIDEGATGAVWLDGREAAGNVDETGHGEGAMTLRFAELDGEGVKIREELLDDRICDCCQTSAVAIESGAIAVYRNRTEDEIRDIWMVRFDGQHWSAPQPLSEDGWNIAGCPVNGPAIASEKSTVAVAWFTGANDRMAVKLKLSTDGGDSFGSEIRVDDGNPIGRVDVEVLHTGEVVVSWVETLENKDVIRVKVFNQEGVEVRSQDVAVTSSSRKSGFPKMVLMGSGDLLFAWTSVEENTIKTAILKGV